jgi:hypothetical protein
MFILNWVRLRHAKMFPPKYSRQNIPAKIFLKTYSRQNIPAKISPPKYSWKLIPTLKNPQNNQLFGINIEVMY